MSGRLPVFLIIGAAKAGTSTFFAHLRRHPQICVPDLHREPAFFAEDAEHARGLDWYTGLFASARPGQICGEKSTAYARWPECPHAAPRIAETIPEVRFIYMLRHPVERAYSHYVHRITKEMAKGRPIAASFEEHVKQDSMCVNSSDYALQLDQYLPYFPLERFLFLFHEDMRSDLGDMLTRATRFLGLDDHDLLADGPIHKNKTTRHIEHAIRREVLAPLSAIPGARLASRITPPAVRKSVYSVLRRSRRGRQAARLHEPLSMRPETRAALIGRYRESNTRIERITGRDLAHWNE